MRIALPQEEGPLAGRGAGTAPGGLAPGGPGRRSRQSRPRAARLDREALHLLLGDVEVRVDALDVVEVLEGVGEPQHLLGLLALEPDGEARAHLEPPLERAAVPLLERPLDRPAVA